MYWVYSILFTILVSVCIHYFSTKTALYPLTVKGGGHNEWIYHVYPNIMGSSALRQAVSIVVHGDFYNLHYLPMLLHNWAGPVAVVLYCENEKLLNLSVCYLKQIRDLDRITVHLVVPFSVSVQTVTSSLDYNDCLSNSGSYEDKRLNYDESADIPYPANILRNVGRNYSNCDYNLVLDMDIIPNQQCYSMLNQFVLENVEDLEFVALVMPVFEVANEYCGRSGFPQTKPDLKTLISNGSSRIFYSDLNIHVQSSTQNGRWLGLPSHDDLHIAYWVDWQDPYEPFIVQHKSAPAFPQQFVGYGSNRLSQLMLLDKEGVVFGVLDECFVIHCGLKTKDSLTSHKLKQLHDNKILYEKLKND